MPRKKENKRNDGYYEVKCIIDRTFDGKPIYKSFYSSKSKTDARAKAEAYKLELFQKQTESEHITFEAYAAEYLERFRQHARSNTHKTTECVFRLHLIPWFGEMKLNDIKKADIEKFIAHQQKKYQYGYVKKQIGDFAACMNDAMYNGYIEKPPCHNLKYKPEQKKEKRVYTAEQTEQVLEYCKQDAYGLQIHIMLSYGMSRSEFLGISINDVDFDNLTISINKGVTLDKGKKMNVAAPKNPHRNRIIAISKETADWIKADCKHKYIANPYDDKITHSHTFHKLYYGFMARMHEYYQGQGFDVPMLNPHELRHTRATLWVNQGKNLFAIAEMLGWSDLTMLRKVYGHADIQELRKNLEI